LRKQTLKAQYFKGFFLKKYWLNLDCFIENN